MTPYGIIATERVNILSEVFKILNTGCDMIYLDQIFPDDKIFTKINTVDPGLCG
jgi:hypothetical protein